MRQRMARSKWTIREKSIVAEEVFEVFLEVYNFYRGNFISKVSYSLVS